MQAPARGSHIIIYTYTHDIRVRMMSPLCSRRPRCPAVSRSVDLSSRPPPRSPHPPFVDRVVVSLLIIGRRRGRGLLRRDARVQATGRQSFARFPWRPALLSSAKSLVVSPRGVLRLLRGRSVVAKVRDRDPRDTRTHARRPHAVFSRGPPSTTFRKRTRYDRYNDPRV